ncbi:MAG TPA: Na+/H+ antiporter NhaC family protein [Longimicrobium sp.]|nr:Na+/H+ antiporter NhaC family protein [Longimicrobium sp.]
MTRHSARTAAAVAALLVLTPLAAQEPGAAPAPPAAAAAQPATPPAAQAPAAPDVSPPAVVLPGAPFTITVTLPDDAPETPVVVRGADGSQVHAGTLQAGENKLEELTVSTRAQLPLRVEAGGASVPVAPRWLPGWVAILPPLVAIALALIFREVVISLFAGVWVGAFLMAGLNPFSAVLRVADSYALPALTDGDHAAIVIFSLLIGGMVGIIGRNGGTHGIVQALAPYATTPRRGLLATYAQGLAIFFDDYANTLIVGNTMRPVTDRLRVSREKLAYVVDSTAAPVASLMFVSTWIGYELSLIATGLRTASENVAATNPQMAAQLAAASPFNVFLDSLPYRFYPLLTLVFVFLVIWMRRDFGPMHAAETRAGTGGGVYRPGAALMTDTSSGTMDPREGAPLRWANALVPVLVVVVTVLIGLYATGRAALGPGSHSLRDVIGEANPFSVLLWASLLGCITAIVLSVAQRILTVQQSIDAWVAGIRAMMLAMVILVLAWSLGAVTENLGTAPFISGMLQGNLPPQLLPVLVFLAAAGIAFATGTSWGTMAILYPLVMPLGIGMAIEAGMTGPAAYTVMVGVMSSVLAGAIFGDHCSPISDTTVLSSMASACDHVDHVRTQLPYALLVAAVGMVVGDVPTAYGVSPWISLAVGAAVLYAVLRYFGRGVPDSGATPTPAAAEAAAHRGVATG